MGGVALNRLKILISTFHDWSKKTKITTGRIFLRLRYVYIRLLKYTVQFFSNLDKHLFSRVNSLDSLNFNIN